MSIAFFDLDKTLLAENSAKLWVKDLWAQKQISVFQMIHASYWLTKYHLGFTKLDEVIDKWLKSIKGESQEKALKATRKFFKESIQELYRPGALEAIAFHRKLGHKVSLLTSCYDTLATMVKEDLKLDDCLCTHLEVKNGLYTGKSVGPACFGKNKIKFAQQLCEKYDTTLDECAFYTDSASDIPLLELVRYPVAVNPDPRLRATAQLRKWPVVNWGRPSWGENRLSNKAVKR